MTDNKLKIYADKADVTRNTNDISALKNTVEPLVAQVNQNKVDITTLKSQVFKYGYVVNNENNEPYTVMMVGSELATFPGIAVPCKETELTTQSLSTLIRESDMDEHEITSIVFPNGESIPSDAFNGFRNSLRGARNKDNEIYEFNYIHSPLVTSIGENAFDGVGGSANYLTINLSNTTEEEAKSIPGLMNYTTGWRNDGGKTNIIWKSENKVWPILIDVIINEVAGAKLESSKDSVIWSGSETITISVKNIDLGYSLNVININGIEYPLVDNKVEITIPEDEIEARALMETNINIVYTPVPGPLSTIRSDELFYTSTGRLLSSFEGDSKYIAYSDDNGKTWTNSIGPDDGNFGKEMWDFAEKNGIIVTQHWDEVTDFDLHNFIYYSDDDGATFKAATIHSTSGKYYGGGKSVFIANGKFIIPLKYPDKFNVLQSDLVTEEEYRVNYIYSADGKNWYLPEPELGKASGTGSLVSLRSVTGAPWGDKGFVLMPYQNGGGSTGGELYRFYLWDESDQKFIYQTPNNSITPGQSGVPSYGGLYGNNVYEELYCTNNYLLGGGETGLFVSYDNAQSWEDLTPYVGIKGIRGSCKSEAAFIFGNRAGAIYYSLNLASFNHLISLPGVTDIYSIAEIPNNDLDAVNNQYLIGARQGIYLIEIPKALLNYHKI